MTNSSSAPMSVEKKPSRTKQAEMLPRPDHVKVVGYQSPDWEKLTRKDGAFKKGRDVAMSLWGSKSDERYPTTFVGKSPEEVREMFFKLCRDERMLDVERRWYEKFGGYSQLPFQEWSDKVMALFPNKNTFNPNKDCLAQAIRMVYDELLVGVREVFNQDVIVPLTIEEALDKIKKGANSGFPYFSKHWGDKEPDGTWKNPHMVEYYVNQAKSLVNGVNVIADEPYVLFKRISPDGLNNPKMRPIECPSKTEALAGKSIADSFVKVMKTIDCYYGMNGSDKCGNHVHKLFEYDYVVEGDFSSFDNTAGPLMPYVFLLIKALTPKSHHQYLQNLLRFYQYPKLLTPMGLVSSDLPSGLMSGSSLTSLIGTLTNSIAVKYVMLRMKVNSYTHLSFGDDIALGCDRFNLDEFTAYNAELNLVCNKEKQGVSHGDSARVSFLGYYHFKGDPVSTGIFPIMRSASGLCFRESFNSVEDICDELEIDAEEFSGTNKLGIDLLAFVSKLNNLRNQVNFTEIIKMFRENESHGMNTKHIVPFERLAMGVRCGRTSDQVGLEGSPVMIELYKLESETGVLELPTSELVEVVTTNDNVMVLQIVDLSKSVDDPERTRYTRVVDTNVDDVEKALTKLSNKLEGMRVLKHAIPKKVKEVKPQTEALTYDRIDFLLDVSTKYLPKSKKFQATVVVTSPINNKQVKTFTMVGESAIEAELELAKLVYQFEERVTKSNQLYELATV